MTSCDEWENWCNRGPNVTRSCLDSIKNICSDFEIDDDNIIRKMLFYSNLYSAPQITRSRSAPIADTNSLKQNNTGSTKSTLPEPVESISSTPSTSLTDPYFLQELKILSWEDLATMESNLLEDGWEPKRLKWYGHWHHNLFFPLLKTFFFSYYSVKAATSLQGIYGCF